MGSDSIEVPSGPKKKSSAEIDQGVQVKDGQHQVSETKSDRQNNDLQIMSLLKPAKILIIEIVVNQQKMEALIDTGATVSLMKESVYKTLTDKKLNDQKATIHGLNNAQIETKGGVNLEVNYFGETINAHFQITDDAEINYCAILGMDFLHDNHILINICNRRVSKCKDDGSITHVYLTPEGKIKQIMYENIPVYSKEKKTIRCQEVTPIEVTTNIDTIPDLNCALLYIEDNYSDKHVDTYNGILDLRSKEKFVYMTPSVEAKRKKIIKQGEVVGRGNTLLTLEVENKDVNSERWSYSKLKSEIILDDNLTSHQKDSVYEMLMEKQGSLSINNADIGQASVTPHHIDLTDDTPIWQNHRSFAEPVNQEVEKQCQELLDNDIIEHSSSDWSSPIVPVCRSMEHSDFAWTIERSIRLPEHSTFLYQISPMTYTKHIMLDILLN